MLQLGVHSLALTQLWRPAEADALVPPLLEHGVRVIETPLLDPKNYDSKGTRIAAEKHQIEIVCSLGLPEEFNVTTHTDDVIEYLGVALEVARDAGSDVLSGVTYGTIGKTSGEPRSTRELDAICRLVDKTAANAKRLGIRLGLEPCNRYETHLLNTASQTVEIIERVGADNVFVHLDTYHMNIEEQGMEQGFSDAGNHLGYVHLSESHRGVPGRGTINWNETFTALNNIKFNGVLTLESFVYLAPEIAAGLAVWRPVVEDPRAVIDEGLPFLINEMNSAGLAIDAP